MGHRFGFTSDIPLYLEQNMSDIVRGGHSKKIVGRIFVFLQDTLECDETFVQFVQLNESLRNASKLA